MSTENDTNATSEARFVSYNVPKAFLGYASTQVAAQSHNPWKRSTGGLPAAAGLFGDPVILYIVSMYPSSVVTLWVSAE